MTHTISPEQRLFMGVIVQAIVEASATTHGIDPAKEDARAWFENGGDDFAAVCEFAGYEPATVRDRALAYLDRVKADPTSAIIIRRARGRVAQARGATMADVARTAGVSTITVARALNQTGPCAPATRARVIKAAQALGYSVGGSTSVH